MTVIAADSSDITGALGPDALSRTLEALRRLHAHRTTDDIFRAAANTLALLGLRRAAVARRVDGHWDLVTPDDVTEPVWPSTSQLWPSAKTGDRSNVVPMFSVSQPADYPSVAGYTAVPVSAHDQVVAILYVVPSRSSAESTALQDGLVALYALGLGLALERAQLSERLDALRVVLDAPTVHHASAARVGEPAVKAPEGQVRTLPTQREIPQEPLTPRERAIMEHVAKGHTNTQVARRLLLSEGTVKWHMKNILRKLDAPNRAAAVSFWLCRNV